MHIVCQNMDGDLIYLKYNGEKWHKFTILVSKTKGAYDKHFLLLPTGSCLQLFYVLRSGVKNLLVQQILSDDTPQQPCVAAQISGGAQAFAVSVSQNLDTEIYCQNEQNILGSRTYKWSSKSFGTFAPVFGAPAYAPYTAFDSFGREHICFVSGKEIIYKQRGLDRSFCKESSIALPLQSETSALYLRFDDEKIYIIWKHEYGVFYSASQNDGETFCAPVKLLCSGSEPILFTLHTKLGRIPALGYFLSGEVKFYNIAAPQKQIFQKHMPVKPAANPESDVSELDGIKNTIRELKKEVKELGARVEMAISMLRKN